MLSDQIDPILADLIRRRVAFSHYDVVARLPQVAPDQAEEVRLLVFEKMIGAPSYRLSVVRFVGEGLALMCTPCEGVPEAPSGIESPLPVLTLFRDYTSRS
jgi:hypothetical protein